MSGPEPTFVIETDRLILRPLDPDGDLVALHRIGADPRVAGMMASIKGNWTLEEAGEFLERAMWRGRLGFRLAVALRAAPIEMIGTVGIGGSPVSCAYFLAPVHWGQGLATEAMAAFLPAVMTRFGVKSVGAGHFADNLASGAVLRKLGFRPDGEDMEQSAAREAPALVKLYRLDRADG